MKIGIANFIRRLLAFAIDWLIFALWGSSLFLIVMLVTGGDPPRPSGPWKAQAIGFLAVTLPFTLYFALCECSRRRASIGKRVVGLRVSRKSREQLSFKRALLRNAIKFIPWECGHMLTQQASMTAEDDPFPMWLWGPALISIIVPLWWLVSLYFKGQTPYDRWTDARITRKT